MAATLSDDLGKLLDSPVFVTLATIQPDGSPQLSVVWVKRDSDDLLVSTTTGRRKEKNIRRDPRVTVLANPADAPYTYAEIRGTATLGTEGGQELIDELSLKYTGRPYDEFNPAADEDAERVVVPIAPARSSDTQPLSRPGHRVPGHHDAVAVVSRVSRFCVLVSRWGAGHCHGRTTLVA
ncbi:PPOX class F420-dependent oxidoreductase [Streptomyces sp. 8N706]|uniref:PPOX class F420-dependent oxidoreductase n=1 Tax=Streptomyces sp. 8N706 TaxID=3457416 RepID=UPI003FD64944